MQKEKQVTFLLLHSDFLLLPFSSLRIDLIPGGIRSTFSAMSFRQPEVRFALFRRRRDHSRF
jgi:hypothetical protein